MPNQELLTYNTHSDRLDQGAYDKIFARIYPDHRDTSILGRTNRVHVSFRNTASFDDILKAARPDEYAGIAGADVSTVFMAYQSRINQTSGFPSFASGVKSTAQDFHLPSGQSPNLQMLLPFNWEPFDPTNITDRYYAPSGDALALVSSHKGLSSYSSRYRDSEDIRGIGIRLPAMAAGWSYTLDSQGCQPMPSGARPAGAPSGSLWFAGEPPTQKGYQVDPSRYIVAPIDFRYDIKRHVYTCGAPEIRGSRRYTVFSIIDDLPESIPAFDYPRFS